MLPAEKCIYTPCYCEENVWHLCKHAQQNFPAEDLNHCFVIFISNTGKMIPLWCQRASKDKSHGLVVWDYHVIFVIQQENGSVVYDLDTTLSFPCTVDVYAMMALQEDHNLNSQYHRMFRVISALQFLETFASDRSHMKNENGEWLKPPPNYPRIKTLTSINNLPEFINMEPSIGYGVVLTLEQFKMKFK